MSRRRRTLHRSRRADAHDGESPTATSCAGGMRSDHGRSWRGDCFLDLGPGCRGPTGGGAGRPNRAAGTGCRRCEIPAADANDPALARCGAASYRKTSVTMKSHTHYLTMHVPARMDFVNITKQVAAEVSATGVK